jgi:hypothetical protein
VRNVFRSCSMIVTITLVGFCAVLALINWFEFGRID